MGTTNNTERASAGAGTTACPCGAETSGAEGSRTRGYTALQVLDLLNAQQVALLAGAEKRAARLRDAVFAAGRAAGAPEGLDPVALAEWLGQTAALAAVRAASPKPARERLEVGGPEDAFHAVFTREYGASRWVYGCEHIADELRDNFYFKAQNGVKVYSYSHLAIGDEEVFLRGIHKNRDLETRILSVDPGRYIDALREALPVARQMVERARRAAKGGVA